jgi:ubiquinone/menaquinone biosynthesis C-methylase UbiE
MTEMSSTQKAYDQIYRGEGILLQDSFYLWLLELLKLKEGKRLLDISCGEGRLVVLARMRGLEAIGLDFSYVGLTIGHSQDPRSGWVTGDGQALPFPGDSMDYVTHIGSLEHYLDPGNGAREIRRVLKPDGQACILVPNAFGLFGNIQHVWSHGEVFDDSQPLQRYATRLTWERLLADNGLVIHRVVGYGEVERPRTRVDWLRYLKNPRKIIRIALSRMTPVNLANHFVFLCGAGAPD